MALHFDNNPAVFFFEVEMGIKEIRYWFRIFKSDAVGKTSLPAGMLRQKRWTLLRDWGLESLLRNLMS